MVHARGVGHPPPGRLEVDPDLGDEPEGPTDHSCGHAPAGHLGQEGDVGRLCELTEDHAQPLGVGALVGAGQGPDATGGGHRAAATEVVRRTCEIVAEPTTRVPS